MTFPLFAFKTVNWVSGARFDYSDMKDDVDSEVQATLNGSHVIWAECEFLVP